MPELPEVQTVVADLIRAGLVGARISNAQVRWPRTISVPSASQLVRRLVGTVITGIDRRGKYIMFHLSSGEWLFVHLRMTGSFRLDSGQNDPHDRVVVQFSDGRQMQYHDPRKFGRWFLLTDPSEITNTLGDEPLKAAFTPQRLAFLLKSRRRMLKPLLLDQTVIAGIGNIYADEALWEARLHPCRIAATLDGNEIRALCKAIRLVLRRGIRNMGTTLGTGEANFYSVGKRHGRNRDELKVFRRAGRPCPRCGSSIIRLVVAQRSTHICPRCQVTGRPVK